MSPFPHVRREVPITDPRWLASTQPDPEDAQCETDGCTSLAPPWDLLCTECSMERYGQADGLPDPEPEADERRGLDGNGAMHAADLPSTSYTWGYLAAPAENEDIDLEEDLPVTRTLCLALSDDRTLPLQCRIRNGHVGKHDWETEKDDLLSVRRREELDTPSGRLPVRVAGEAMREAQESEVLETWEA